MKSRAIIPLVVGLAVGGIAIKGFLNILKKAKGANVSELVEVVRASADIAPTLEITEAMVSRTSVPKALAPDGVFSDPGKVIGRVTSQMIPKGMPITASLLAPEGTPPGMVARIPDGYRAVAIQVDEIIGVGGFIKPGSRVDIVIVMSGQDRNQNISRVILQNIEVLAVGQKTESGGQSAAVTRSVTVLVKPDEAAKLHLASTKGKLRLTLRSQDDRREPRAVTLTDEDLLTDGPGSRNKSANQDSVFERLFGNLPKVGDSHVDEGNGFAGQASADQQRGWVVEVLSGAESYQVQFGPDGKPGEVVPGEGRTANKAPSLRGTGSPRAPGGYQGTGATDSTTANPNAGGSQTGAESQSKTSETP